MTQITFKTEDSHVAFHGMAEGMLEIALDDSRNDAAVALERLITATGDESAYPASYTVDAGLIETLWHVMENLRADWDEDHTAAIAIA